MDVSVDKAHKTDWKKKKKKRSSVSVCSLNEHEDGFKNPLQSRRTSDRTDGAHVFVFVWQTEN